jgi:hypothetical protein
MRWNAFMPAIWGFVVLLVILLAVVLWLVPARDELQGELNAARGEVPLRRSALPSLVGASYEQDLRNSLSETDGMRSVLDAEFKKQAVALEQWFPDVKMVDDAPARDEFANAFRFAQDELRREIVGKAAQRSRVLEDLPLHTPVFVQKNQTPTVEEMTKVQREANLEALLLRCAGAAGAYPYRAIDFQEGWSAGSGGGSFRESSVTLYLSLPATALHDALRALCELKGKGPIVRIEALTTRPRALPDRLDPDEMPLIDADVQLVVSTVRK